MVSAKYGARLSQDDLNDLNAASTHLYEAAEAIKRANPIWAGAVVQLLILANETINRLGAKGQTAFQRHLEKRGMARPQDAPEEPAAAGDPDENQTAAPAKPPEN